MDAWVAVVIAAVGSVGLWTTFQKVVDAWFARSGEDAKRQLVLSDGWGKLATATQDQLDEERLRAAEVERVLRARVSALEEENDKLRDGLAEVKIENKELRASVARITRRLEALEGHTPPGGTPAVTRGDRETT